jgi:hypothetical protein
MKTRLLIIAVALAGLFGSQQAVAKSHKQTTKASSKKHHKKHKMSTVNVIPAGRAA